jgi:ABC-2 type transport system permease protein
MLVTGLGLWVGYVAADGPPIGSLLIAALAWAPASWVTSALAALCFALRPAWTGLGWIWPGAFLVFSVTGESLRFPGWLMGVSPYDHVPQLPVASWDWPAEIGLTALAATLLVVAWWRFRERDIG